MVRQLPYHDYRGDTRLKFFGFLLLPALVCFVGLLLQHDFLFVLLEMAILAYWWPFWTAIDLTHANAGMLFHLDLLSHTFKNEREPQEEIMPAMIYSCINGVIMSIILILFSKFVPFGPSSVILQAPVFSSKALAVVYWMFWAFLWVVVLPIIEVIYFFCLQAALWHNVTGGYLLVAAGYALMNWTWLWFVVGDWHWCLGLTGVSFVMGWLAMKYDNGRGGLKVHMFRAGLAIGIMALMVFWMISFPNVKTPDEFQSGTKKNIWTLIQNLF